MPTGEYLTPTEEEHFRDVYRRDVKFWNWNLWLLNLKKFQQANMGFTWVILPYRPEKLMPIIRRRMNELYYEALNQEAAEYGLMIWMDEGKQKLILIDPETQATLDNQA